MRLKVSKAQAEEVITSLVSEGFGLASWMNQDCNEKVKQNTFNPDTDNKTYEDAADAWLRKVTDGIKSIFPTDLEHNTFANPIAPVRFSSHSVKAKMESTQAGVLNFTRTLEKILKENLPLYTDLPIKMQLFVEDIDSFKKV